MDNFAIALDCAMHSYFPSRRWRLRRIRTAHDKELRKLENEYWRLVIEKRNLGYVALQTPIRCGYKRLFMLTEDCKHTPNPNFYQNILDKINDIRYSSTKEFVKKRNYRDRKRRKRKQTEQKLKEPRNYHFHEILKFTEDEKRMFYEIKCCDRQIEDEVKYVFSEPWRFVLRIRPHWITEVKRKDTLLEQQLAEIERILDLHKNKKRLTKMRGGYGYSWKRIINKVEDRKLYAYNSLKNKQLHLIMDEYNNEK